MVASRTGISDVHLGLPRWVGVELNRSVSRTVEYNNHGRAISLGISSAWSDEDGEVIILDSLVRGFVLKLNSC